MKLEAPKVESQLVDPASGVTYRVLAYRKLTATELRMAVAAHHSPKAKPVKRGDVITIVTLLGL